MDEDGRYLFDVPDSVATPALTVDRAGNVLIADRINRSLNVWFPDIKCALVGGTPAVTCQTFAHIDRVCIDLEGRVWVGNLHTGRIEVVAFRSDLPSRRVRFDGEGRLICCI